MRNILLNIEYWFLNIICFLVLGHLSLAKAIYDPLSVPNNRVGVHILEPSEVFRASQLVNSNGGDWGFVTIPIRSDDRDFLKWEGFFRACKEFHLIPIIRLATFPDKSHWVSPTPLDILDFANFLSLMPWPTQNRYIVLFNEPNHANEWGGSVEPEEYIFMAKLASDLFKTRSQNYFLISAGLDMSAPTNHTSIDALLFYRQMFAVDPNWPQYFDGISFHPYPNPAFSATAFTKNRYGIRSYEFELNYLKKYGFKPKYLFFTETGTIRKSGFYTQAFSVWQNPKIVAITPFILYAGAGNFSQFSLLDPNHQPTTNYREILNLVKVAGQPLLASVSATFSSPSNTSTDTKPDQAQVKSFWRNFLDYFTLKNI